jgi:hypothetical protein
MYAAYYGGSSDDDEDESATEIHRATQPHISDMYATPTTTSPNNMTRDDVDAAAPTTAPFPYPLVSLAALTHQPFFGIIARGSDFSIVRLSCGSLASCLPLDLARACTLLLSPATPTGPPRSTRPYVTTSTPRADLGIRYEAPSRAASWMIDDGDERTEAQADADWHRANAWVRPQPSTSFLSSRSSVPTPITPTPTPIMPTPPLPHLGAQHQPWGDGPPHVATPPIAQGWQVHRWAAHEGEPEPEPQAWRSRQSYSDDDDDPPLYHYVQTRSSFQGGTTVNATGFIRDPFNQRNPLSTRPLLIGLDSYSDVTVASRDIAYNIHPIHEHLSTGGGDTEYHEEGLVDIVDGACSFRTIPALVASDPSHLPTKCMLLLGVPQLNELNIKVDTHRKTRRLPLESYDPSINFSADTFLQCRMAEKDLLAKFLRTKQC